MTTTTEAHAALARCDDAARRAEMLDYADLDGLADTEVTAALAAFQAAAETLRAAVGVPLSRLDASLGDEGGWLTPDQARAVYGVPTDSDWTWAVRDAGYLARIEGIPPRVSDTDPYRRYPRQVWEEAVRRMRA